MALDRIEAEISPANEHSIRIAERLGMRKGSEVNDKGWPWYFINKCDFRKPPELRYTVEQVNEPDFDNVVRSQRPVIAKDVSHQ